MINDHDEWKVKFLNFFFGILIVLASMMVLSIVIGSENIYNDIPLILNLIFVLSIVIFPIYAILIIYFKLYIYIFKKKTTLEWLTKKLKPAFEIANALSRNLSLNWLNLILVKVELIEGDFDHPDYFSVVHIFNNRLKPIYTGHYTNPESAELVKYFIEFLKGLNLQSPEFFVLERRYKKSLEVVKNEKEIRI